MERPTPYEMGYYDGVNAMNKRTQYKCRTVTLIPPQNLLFMNVQTTDEIQYKNMKISVDACIADEISELWTKHHIRTTGCCCGHGSLLGFIEVEENDIKKMENLGYCHYIYHELFGGYQRQDAFIPKTGWKHIYDGYETIE